MIPENSFSLSRLQRFRPQESALYEGFLLMLSSGIHMNYGFLNWESVDVPWLKYSPLIVIEFSASSWFFGGIVGHITFIMNAIHTASTFITMFTIDKGRRIHFISSACGTSFALIFLGIVNGLFSNSFSMVIALFIAFECFSAIGLGLTANIYSTESFPISKKNSINRIDFNSRELPTNLFDFLC